MPQLLASLSNGWGLGFVVVNVLLDQIGLPVPAVPTLVVAGALAADHRLFGLELFIGASLACLIPDLGWYLAGRTYGNRVMKTLCRISLNPDTCVSQTQLRFERWGPGAIIFAKFVPGLAIIAPPLAGATGMAWPRFLLLSSLSAVLWVGLILTAGALLKPQIQLLMPHAQHVASMAGTVIAVLLAAYIAWKWWQRRLFYHRLRMARISVAELYELMEAGASPVIVDVRSVTARTLDPRQVPGAISITLQEVASHLSHLPHDREIVLYCSCPNEASAAQVARVLVANGFKRVRPLFGGLEAWIAAGYAAETLPARGASVVLSTAQS
jgi:membrane protein DedA with SNARE-associated domain/rhodanese-related sulfurtransferase